MSLKVGSPLSSCSSSSEDIMWSGERIRIVKKGDGSVQVAEAVKRIEGLLENPHLNFSQKEQLKTWHSRFKTDLNTYQNIAYDFGYNEDTFYHDKGQGALFEEFCIQFKHQSVVVEDARRGIDSEKVDFSLPSEGQFQEVQTQFFLKRMQRRASRIREEFSSLEKDLSNPKGASTSLWQRLFGKNRGEIPVLIPHTRESAPLDKDRGALDPDFARQAKLPPEIFTFDPQDITFKLYFDSLQQGLVPSVENGKIVFESMESQEC